MHRYLVLLFCIWVCASASYGVDSDIRDDQCPVFIGWKYNCRHTIELRFANIHAYPISVRIGQYGAGCRVDSDHVLQANFVGEIIIEQCFPIDNGNSFLYITVDSPTRRLACVYPVILSLSKDITDCLDHYPSGCSPPYAAEPYSKQSKS